jgi:hypothetical protein
MFRNGFHSHAFNVRETLRRCKWESIRRSKRRLGLNYVAIVREVRQDTSPSQS